MKKTLNKEYGRTLRLAVPIILSQVGQIAVQLADNIMVGRLGALPLAAVSFGGTVAFILFIAGLGMSLGITPLVGEAYAQHRNRDSASYLLNSILLYFGIGVVILGLQYATIPLLGYMGQPDDVVEMAIPYYKYMIWSVLPFMLFAAFKQFLEGIGNTTVAMVIVIIADGLNVILNYMFIYGNWGAPAMGAEGAGLASLISRMTMPISLIIYCFCYRKMRRYLMLCRKAKIEASRMWQLIKIGFPISIQMSFESWAFCISNIMMGWLGTVAIAANQVTMTMCNVAFMTLIGIGSATTIRISHAYGRKDFKEIKRIGASSYRIGLIWNAFTAFMFIALRKYIPMAFTSDSEVILLTSHLLILAGLFQFSDGMQCIGMGILRGLQDVRITMVIAAVAYIIINIPLAYILAFTFNLGEYGIWCGYIFGLSVAAFLLIRRYRNNLKKAESL